MSHAFYIALAIIRVVLTVLVMTAQLTVWLVLNLVVPALRAAWEWLLSLAAASASHQIDKDRDEPKGPPQLPPPPTRSTSQGDAHLDERNRQALAAVRASFETHGAKTLSVPDPEAALAPRLLGRQPRVPPWVEILRREGYRIVWAEHSQPMNCPAWVVTKADPSESRWAK
jgi:hypothetical protein